MLPDSIAALAPQPRWVAWRSEVVKGRATKVPYSATGGKAKSTDPNTWSPLGALPLGAFDGPGIVLGDGLQGVDMDACICDDGHLEPWAQEVLDRLDTYCEVSPSGRGIKALFYGPEGKAAEVGWGDPVQMPDGTTKRRELAYFTTGRYFTITGRAHRDVPIATIDADTADWLRGRVAALRAERDGARPKGPPETRAARTFDIGRLPAWAADLIRTGCPEGEDRSTQFYKVVKELKRRKLDAAQITSILAEHPQGIGAKYAGRLADEVQRVTDKPNGNEVDISAITGVEPIAPEFSDDYLALAFVKQYGPGFRWTPGMDWMRDDGAHWTRDDHLTRWQAARTICRAAAHEAPEKGNDRKRLASAKTVAAVLTLAQTDPRIVVPATAWDAQPMLLNTPAGIVDLTTGKMRSRGPRDYMTQITAVAPSTTLPAPNWLRFITEVFSGDAEMVAFVQRVLGYCLTGDRREQKVFFAHGEGSNGKNTLVDQVLWIMGTYALKLPTSTLMQSAVERHPTELAQLRGKRLAISNELDEGQFWAEARIKELTGDEFLNARFMRQDSFTFLQTQKHLIAGNYKPRLRGGDPAMARRMVLIPFVETFDGPRKDLSLPAKIRAEAPAVLAWLIAGAVAWHRDGLGIPPKVTAASRDYMAEHDDVSMWMDEACSLGPAADEHASTLYQHFRLWKQDRGEHAPSQTVWGQRMAMVQKIERRKSHGTIRYFGVRLRDSARARLDALRSK